MKERFSAKDYINYITSKRKIELKDLEVGEIVVFSWMKSIITSLAKRTNATTPKKSVFSNFYTTEINKKKISFTHIPTGAPVTIMNMEEMIACNTKIFIGLGLAGSLQPNIPVGSFIIPTNCISEEGTSKHYIKKNESIMPNNHLVDILKKSCEDEEIPCFIGKHWTIDAPYRETINKINAYSKQNVLSVDMETSAMYSVGMYRKVKVCNLLVISDELWHEWKPMFSTPELRKAVKKTEKVILNAIFYILNNSI